MRKNTKQNKHKNKKLSKHKSKNKKDIEVLSKGQKKIKNYSIALKVFWRQLYGNGGSGLYSLEKFYDEKPKHFNVEHVFPMAWIVNELKCIDRKQCRKSSKQFNYIESDLHNLFPSRKDMNMLRGSYGFGEIKGDVRFKGRYQFEIDHKKRIVEPHPASQGEIARAMFYMSNTYQLRLFDKQVKRLTYWSHIDPPSTEEHYRNDLIETLQGNRNHYIDFPDKIDSFKSV